MMRKRNGLARAVLLCAITGALGVGVGTLAVARDTSDRVDKVVPAGEDVVFPHNAKGLSYGPIGQLRNPANEPDLIAVGTNEGTSGYVYRDELNGPVPKTPAEAQALNKTRERTITVYSSDGVSKVGTFTIGGGTGVTTR